MPSTLTPSSVESSALTFQDLLFRLQAFWAARGCVLQQPYDVEVGAGTMGSMDASFCRVFSAAGMGRSGIGPVDGRIVARVAAGCGDGGYGARGWGGNCGPGRHWGRMNEPNAPKFAIRLE